MISRDSLKQKLDICPDEYLQQVADFLESLMFRSEKTIDRRPTILKRFGQRSPLLPNPKSKI
jgi:hypothetical protein